MAKEFHSGPEKGKPIYNQNSFPLRLLAILLMIAGAAGFVATLLVLDGQELFYVRKHSHHFYRPRAHFRSPAIWVGKPGTG